MKLGCVVVLFAAACGGKSSDKQATGSASGAAGTAASGGTGANAGTTTGGTAGTGTAATGTGNATGSAGNATGSADGSAATGRGPEAGKIYASVFTKGASFSFTVETKTTPPIDMGKPTTDKKPNHTCKVTDVHDMKSARMAKVECTDGKEPMTGDYPPAGWYVASTDGLWYIPSTDDKAHDRANALDAKKLLIQATPATRNFEGKGPDEGETWVYETKKDGEAWCGYYSHALGDEGGYGVCFDAKGMSKANYFQAGATTVETFFRRS